MSQLELSPLTDRLVLSDHDIRFFLDEGYLVVPEVLSANDLDPVIDEITEALDRVSPPTRARFQAGHKSLGRALGVRRIGKVTRGNRRGC